MNTRAIRNVGGLVVAAILAMITPAWAANTNYWTNSVSGSFYTGANYASGTAPVNNNADVVYFTNNATYAVTYSSGFNAAAFYFNASGGVVTSVVDGTISLGYAPQYLGVGDASGSTATVVQVGTAQMSANNTFIGNAGVGSYTVIGGAGANLHANILEIGYTNGSSGSSLVITNGGLAYANGVAVGGFNSADNTLLVTGSGSLWTNIGALSIGYSNSTFNSFRIENGAQAKVMTSLDVGLHAGASNNTVLVTGPNSYLEVGAGASGYIQIGNGDNNNSMIVSNGGSVSDLRQLYIGGTSTPATTNNMLIVTGAGSVFSNTTLATFLGFAGGGNTLRIENGAQMASVANGVTGSSLGITVAKNAAASNNNIIVTGSNSVWGISASGVNPEFTLGLGAGGNTMIISNGGSVRFDGTYFEIGSATSSNTVLVTGAGSTFSNRDANFDVGYAASGIGANNRLLVENGGFMTASNMLIGAIVAGASNATVSVTGTGSLLQVSYAVTVGVNATNALLSIADAGVVQTTNAIVGQSTGSYGEIRVNGGSLFVTNAAVGATLNVLRGQLTVSNNGIAIVDRLLATNSSGRVTFNSGTLISQGTTVSNSQNFVIGDTGSGGATYVANGGTHRFLNDLVVGNSTGANAFVISNAATVVNGVGYIGSNVTASGNSVLVTGAGSTWTNTGLLQVGVTGAGNTVRIENGGRVVAGSTVTLGTAATSSNNQVIVTGANSVLDVTAGAFYIGNTGMVNSVVVTNGGTLLTTGLYLGSNTTSTGNSLVVSGTGSIWTNRGILNIGVNGAGNTVRIENGASVLSTGRVTLGTAAASASNNTLLVTDSNTRFVTATNSPSYLEIGTSSDNNKVIVSNGAFMSVGNVTYVGSASYTGTTNAQLIVTGVSSVFSNTGTMFVGYFGSGNTLRIENGGRVDGGSTVTLGQNLTSSNNQAIVSGANSVWDINTTVLNVGTASTGNSVLLTNGGLLLSTTTVVGDTTAATSNSLIASGAGTTWTNSGAVTVGNYGAGNTLRIEAGAYAQVKTILNLGLNVGASNNTVLITGTNSYLEVGTTSGYLQIGLGDNNNTLIVSNGGSLRVLQPFYIGGTGAVTTNNNATVTGPGSVLSNTSTLFIGWTGGGNTLRIENGGQVVSASTVEMGHIVTSSNNQAIVAGTNSVWDASTVNLFELGNVGGGNSILLTNGGKLLTTNTYFGYGNASSAGNSLIASGAGTTWTNTGSLNFGHNGGSNTLRIEDGARVVVGSGIISMGNAVTSSNNLAIVTGTNSVWDASTSIALYVGNVGASNTILVTNGGKLLTAGALFGVTATSTSNAVIVSGAGSIWTNTGILNIGYRGAGNSLQIEAGGQVASVAGSGVNRLSVGALAAAASNNTILVTGPNSVWGISASGASPEFTLGLLAGGNSLIISNGGKVRFDGNYFEIGVNTSSNTVLVTGAGSIFSNANAIFDVGYSSGGGNAPGNRLLIENGGQFTASNLDIGVFQVGSSNSTVSVTGTGSLVQVGSALTVGDVATNALLLVADAGTVQTTNAVVGNTATSSGEILVNGGRFSVTNAAASAVLNVLRGDLTLTSNAVVTVDRLVATNGLPSALFLNGGTLNATSLFVTNGTITGLGDGAQAMVLNLGGGRAALSNGIVIANNATLSGAGTFTASVFSTNATGGTVAATNGVLYLSSGFTGGGQFRAELSGTLFLAVSNSYTGATIINGGRAILANTNAVQNSTLNNLVNGGIVFSNNLTGATAGGLAGSGNFGLTNLAGAGIAFKVGNNSLSTSYSGAMSGSGSLTKIGAGFLTLTGTNTYAGTTTISNGTLRVTGMLAGVGAVTVAPGGTLRGSGVVSGQVNNAGTVFADSTTPLRLYSNLPFVNQASGIVTANVGALIVNAVFTNAGKVTFLNSVGTFNSTVINQGAWISDPSTLTFNSTMFVDTNGYIAAGAGDVYRFASNFVNISSQSATFNTVAAKFVFDGGTNTNLAITGGNNTQQFYVAGLNLGGWNSSISSSNESKFTIGAGTFSTNSFTFNGTDYVAGYTNNFALGTLELGNGGTNTTLTLLDSFGTVGPDDSQVAGLYLNTLTLHPGSLLIISNNVELYFQHTNGVTGLAFGSLTENPTANILLLDGSSFHELTVIPEPSVLMLWLAGCITCWLLRRRRQAIKL